LFTKCEQYGFVPATDSQVVANRPDKVAPKVASFRPSLYTTHCEEEESMGDLTNITLNGMPLAEALREKRLGDVREHHAGRRKAERIGKEETKWLN
jgi:hypothetical protein